MHTTVGEPLAKNFNFNLSFPQQALETECLGSHLGRRAHTPELGCGCERLVLGDGEHQQEALATAEVVVPDGGVVFLARRVQDVDLNVLAVQHHLLPIAVGLGGLVVLHKL